MWLVASDKARGYGTMVTGFFATVTGMVDGYFVE